MYVMLHCIYFMYVHDMCISWRCCQVEQQLSAPLLPGPRMTPYFVEFMCWSRQLREIRRIYRAQYLQKLAEDSLDI